MGVGVGSLVGSSVGVDVGKCVGARLGAGEGATDGVAVGVSVMTHCVRSFTFTTDPSWHTQVQAAPIFTGSVVARSHPWDPSSHACFVGACDGVDVGVSVVGMVVGELVGDRVGEVVARQRVRSVGSLIQPSKHSHSHKFPTRTAIVEAKWHGPAPASHGCSVGK